MCMAGRKRLKLSSSREVRQSVSRVANMVLNGEIAAKDANAIMYAANVILGAIRVDEQEQRLAEIERYIKSKGGQLNE